MVATEVKEQVASPAFIMTFQLKIVFFLLTKKCIFLPSTHASKSFSWCCDPRVVVAPTFFVCLKLIPLEIANAKRDDTRI